MKEERIKMDKLKSYRVNVAKGLNLRKEPNTNSKTQNGENNIIRSMPKGTVVKQISAEPHTGGGYEWYNVRPKDGDIDETGWVASNYLEEMFTPPQPPDLDTTPVASPGSAPAASPSSAPPAPNPTYTFTAPDMDHPKKTLSYSITAQNFDTAKSDGYKLITTSGSEAEKVTINSGIYYITLANLKTIKNKHRWI